MSQYSTTATRDAKIPPHSKELEIAVLGAMMISTIAIGKVLNLINKDVFYFPSHQNIFEAISTLSKHGQNVDILTVSEELTRQDTLEESGGLGYVAEINAETPNAANVEQHCYILLEKYLKRSMIKAASETLENAYDDSVDALELVDSTQKEIDRVGKIRQLDDIKDLSQAFREYQDFLDNPKNQKGYTTGFPSVDEMAVYRRGEFAIVAARPGVGKSAAIVQALEPNCEAGVGVGIVSLEMQGRQIANRIWRKKTGRKYDVNHPNFTDDIAGISDYKVFYSDRSDHDLNGIRRICTGLKDKGCELIFIDYLQIIKMNRYSSKADGLEEIAVGCQKICKDLDIALVGLAQINREGSKRKMGRPTYDDLKGSGGFEQAGRLIIILHRPELLGYKSYEDGQSTKNVVEVNVAKQNEHGGLGTVKCLFDEETISFVERLEQNTTVSYYNQDTRLEAARFDGESWDN